MANFGMKCHLGKASTTLVLSSNCFITQTGLATITTILREVH